MTYKYEKFLVWIITLGSVLILAIPFFVYPRLFYPFISTKIFSFQILVQIIFAAWLILFFYTRKYRVDIKNPLVLTLIIFMGILVLSIFTGMDGYRSFWSTVERMDGVSTNLHFLVWFIVLISVFRERKDWKRFLVISLVVSFIVSLYGLGQKIGWIETPGITGISSRISSTLGNPIYLAVYSMVNIFIAGFLLFSNWFVRKWPFILLIFINMAVIILAASRAVVATMGLAFFVFLIFFLFHHYKERKQIFISLAAILTILFILIVVFIIRADLREAILSRFPTTVQRLANLDITKDERFRVWGIAWEGFKEKPITGWGWGNFNIVSNKHLDSTFSEQWYDYSHNRIMDLLVMTGIPGTAAYLIFYFILLYYSIRGAVRKKKAGEKLAGFILFLLFFTYFVQNLALFDSPAPAIVFYFMVAFVYFYSTSANQDIQNIKPQKDKDLLCPRIKFPNLFTVIVLVLLFSAQMHFNINPAKASMAGVRAKALSRLDLAVGFEEYKKSLARQSFTNYEISMLLATTIFENTPPKSAKDQQIYTEMLNFAISKLEESVARHPYDTQAHLLLGNLYNIAAAANPNLTEQAEIALQKAAALSPKRYIIYVELTRTANLKKNLEEEAKYLQRAVELNPKSAELHWQLAIILLAKEEYDRGLAEIKKAEELGYQASEDLNFNQLLSTAYFQTGQYEKALKLINEGLEKRPNDPSLLVQRIILYEKLGMINLAQSELDKFKVLYPYLIKDVENKLKNTYNSNLKF